MESFDDVSRIFSRFGVLCEILPFLGRYEYWRCILTRVNHESIKTWISYQHAFKQVDGGRPYETVSYRYDTFDKEYMQYLKNPEICLSYKVNVVIGKGRGITGHQLTNSKSMEYFTELLEYYEANDFRVQFEQISLDPRSYNPQHIFKIYKMLHKQGLGKEKLLLRHCIISYHVSKTSNCNSSSWLNELGITDINQVLSAGLTNEQEDKIKLIQCLSPDLDSKHLYSSFALDLFNVTSLDFTNKNCSYKYLNSLAQSGICGRLTELKICYRISGNKFLKKFIEQSPFLNHVIIGCRWFFEWRECMKVFWSVNDTIALSIESNLKYYSSDDIDISCQANDTEKIIFYIFNRHHNECTAYQTDYIKCSRTFYNSGYHLCDGNYSIFKNITKIPDTIIIDSSDKQNILSCSQYYMNIGIAIKSEHVSHVDNAPLNTIFLALKFPCLKTISFKIDQKLILDGKEDYLIENLPENASAKLIIDDDSVSEFYANTFNSVKHCSVTDLEFGLSLNENGIPVENIDRVYEICQTWNLHSLDLYLYSILLSIQYHFNNPSKTRIEEILQALVSGRNLSEISTPSDYVKIE